MLIGATLSGSVIKVVKSFAPNYNTFVLLEMLDSGVSSAIYPSALILAMELAMNEKNILVSCIVLASYPMGQVVTAIIASSLHNYKWLLRVISFFGFLTLPYIWILPESLRWLLVNKKYDRANAMVNKAARMNGIILSPKSHEIIASACKNTSDELNTENNGSFMDIVRDCSLLTRLAICAFCWMSTAFVTYGVSIISVSLQGDKYFNFMIVSFGAVPGILLTYFMLTYMSRRWSMFASLFITGSSILASKYFDGNATLSLLFFFVGKMFVNHAFSTLYLYTNEMWPTVLRHSVMGVCSMIARFGSIAAPMAPLLVYNTHFYTFLPFTCIIQLQIIVMQLLPFYLFSGFAFLSAIVILFLPETFRQRKLPDSISDIKDLSNRL